jgi:hypothetical protein
MTIDMTCRIDGAETLESAKYAASVRYVSKATCSEPNCCSESWWEGELYRLEGAEMIPMKIERDSTTGSDCVECLLCECDDATMENTIVLTCDEDMYY